MRADVAQLTRLFHPKLQTILMDLERHFGVEFTITSLYRHGDNGVHGTIPLRGTDLSCPDRHFGNLVSLYINDLWEYDPDRPELKCCIYHESQRGRGDWHLHVQVHPDTRLRQ